MNAEMQSRKGSEFVNESEKLQRKLFTYFVIIALALLCALNYQLFVFPNRFAPAGLNGICTMIQYVFHINVGYMSLLINIPLSLLVLFRVGKSFAARSMVFVVSFSLALIVLGNMDLSRFAYETENGTSTILGPLVAGVINGAIYSTLVQISTCSGGIDFAAAIVHKNHPEIGFFWITFSLNAVVACTSYFVYDYEIEPVILCILYSFMSSTISDRMVRGRRSAVSCEIITDYPEAISEAIIRQMHHTATLIPAKGMYSSHETSVLLVIVNKGQLPQLAEIASGYPHTFAVISNVNDVLGNFKRLDAHGRKKKIILDVGDDHMA